MAGMKGTREKAYATNRQLDIWKKSIRHKQTLVRICKRADNAHVEALAKCT